MTMERPTVLVVDDEALFRHSVADAVRMANPEYRVLQAEDGEEALQRHRRETRIDVIVTDIRMPRMSGLELVLALRESRYSGVMIVVTAHGDEALERSVKSQGAFRYFEKPVDLEALVEAIRAGIEADRSQVHGITLTGFVQLLEVERKTCLLQVRTGRNSGDLVFRDGRLVDAQLGEERGDEAALAILGWEADVQLDLLVGYRARAETVSEPLSRLLLEAMHRRDEDGPQDTATAGGAEDGTGIGEAAVDALARRRAAAERLATEDVTLAVDDLFDDPVDDPVDDPGPAAPGTAKAPPQAAPTDFSSRRQRDIEDCLQRVMAIAGAVGVSLVDIESAESLGRTGDGGGLDLEAVGAGYSALVRAKIQVIDELHLEDSIEDILITHEHHYHLIRPLRVAPRLFLFVVLDRRKGNLALARHRLRGVEGDLELTDLGLD